MQRPGSLGTAAASGPALAPDRAPAPILREKCPVLHEIFESRMVTDEAGIQHELLYYVRPHFADRLLSIDLRTGTWRSIPVARRRDCAACTDHRRAPASGPQVSQGRNVS